MHRRRIINTLLTMSLVWGIVPSVAIPAAAVSPNIVISQVYGGGGNTGATYTHDFVELFNRGNTAVNLSGWSVQYASATGTGNFSATAISGTVQPGQYYLIQQAAGSGGTTPLPTPDATGAISMSATAGKVIVANTATALACNGGSTVCSSAQLDQIVDLVGYGGANFFEGSGPTGTLANTTAAARNSNGCADTDDNSSDFTVLSPAPRNTASPLSPCASPTNPTGVGAADPSTVSLGDSTLLTVAVTPGTNPTSTGLGVTADLSSIGGSATQVFFDDGTDGDVTAGDNTFSHLATVPVGTVVGDKSLPVTITDAQSRTGTTSISLVAGAVCEQSFTPAYAIQGSGLSAAITGSVTTQGVVVGDYEGPSPTLRGFYLQDPTGDGNAATSDAIFVFNGNNDNVNLGDVVRVSGSAGEFQDQTQISSVTSIVACGTGSVSPVDVSLPVPSATHLEQYEGMLVRFPQTLYVTEHFQLGRFGQVVMSSGGRLAQPTNVVAPGAPALALQAANNLNRIIFDDALNNQNPDPIVFGREGMSLSASNTLRGGDTATNTIGVLTYTWAGNAASGNAYRLRPINALGGSVNFVAANARPPAPSDVGGTLKVASFNLLNYFNTFDGLPDLVDNCTNGVGGAPADCRGADTQAEFDRQWPKTVAAILGMDVDVLGVNEIENDGYGPTSAIADLVDRLNAATAPGTYAFVDFDTATGQVNALGADAIKVGLIYKPGSVTPVGTTAALNTPDFVEAGDGVLRNRATFAQAFEQPNGARFVVSVNHLKSKGSACSAPDDGDGQGNCNVVRTNAANVLADWLATDPTGTGDRDVLIIGDLNSYAQEDPITALKGKGYANLIETMLGPNAYSFVFDGQWGYLDHAMGSPTIVSQVTGVTEWHINADEPGVLDYNTNFKSAGQITDLYAPDQYRVSDHDPVIIGLDLRVFDFSGFMSPIGPGLNTVKAGSAVPIRFGLDGDQGLDVIFDGYPRSSQVDCGTLAWLPNGAEVSNPGSSGLTYDPFTGLYNVSWKTSKSWANTCRVLRLLLVDGSEHVAYFSFKK